MWYKRVRSYVAQSDCEVKWFWLRSQQSHQFLLPYSKLFTTFYANLLSTEKYKHKQLYKADGVKPTHQVRKWELTEVKWPLQYQTNVRWELELEYSGSHSLFTAALLTWKWLFFCWFEVHQREWSDVSPNLTLQTLLLYIKTYTYEDTHAYVSVNTCICVWVGFRNNILMDASCSYLLCRCSD
jgi:hypothetical protein